MEFWGQVSGQVVIFEGSVAKMFRFWSSKIHFWRKSRTKASFWSLKAAILKEVSQNCFVFDLQSFIFEGSLAKKFRFWASKLHFWKKSRAKALFLSFKVSFLKEVSHKSFVFELQSLIFEGRPAEMLRFWASKRLFGGSLAEKLRLTKSHISWQPNHLNLKSFDIQISWISNQLTTSSFESQIDWQPNHLNLRSIDNRITWISNQLTTKSVESQINWQPKSFEPQIRWQPNHLTLNSFESDINWLSNQWNSAHSLPIGSLSLETSAAALWGRYVKDIIN